MNAWDRTPAGVLRGASRTRALVTVEGPDARPRAEQYPDAAAEHRAAWESRQWPVRGPDGSATVDNATVRAEMRRLAGQGWAGAWLDFPELGLPPKELRGLYAAAVAAGSTRVGTTGPAGNSAEFDAMVRDADYAKTPWVLPTGSLARRIG